MSEFIEKCLQDFEQNQYRSEFVPVSYSNFCFIDALNALKLAEEALRSCGWTDYISGTGICDEQKYDTGKVEEAIAAIDALGKEHVVDANKKVD